MKGIFWIVNLMIYTKF